MCVPVQKIGFFSVAPAKCEAVSHRFRIAWLTRKMAVCYLGVVRARHCVFSSLFGEFPFWFLSVNVLLLSFSHTWGATKRQPASPKRYHLVVWVFVV